MAEYGPTPSVTPTALLVNFKHRGDVVNYYNNSANELPAGTPIIQGSLFGVPVYPIKAYSWGVLAVEGVMDFPKAASDGGMAAGTLAYWDDTNKVATGTASGNSYLGKVEIAAATADTRVLVSVEAVANANGSGFGNMPVTAVTAAGSGIADGGALAAGMNVVTGLDNTTAVVLPAAGIGTVVRVKADTTGKTCPVFPQTNSSINAIAANSAITLAALTCCDFVKVSATRWVTMPLLPS